VARGDAVRRLVGMREMGWNAIPEQIVLALVQRACVRPRPGASVPGPRARSPLIHSLRALPCPRDLPAVGTVLPLGN